MYGLTDSIKVKYKSAGISKTYKIDFPGIFTFIKEQSVSSSHSMKRWASKYMIQKDCPSCRGLRLNKESLHFKILNKNISEVSQLDILEFNKWIDEVENHLDDQQLQIGFQILQELTKRIKNSDPERRERLKKQALKRERLDNMRLKHN